MIFLKSIVLIILYSCEVQPVCKQKEITTVLTTEKQTTHKSSEFIDTVQSTTRCINCNNDLKTITGKYEKSTFISESTEIILNTSSKTTNSNSNTTKTMSTSNEHISQNTES